MLLWLAATAFGAESYCFESGLRVAIARDATRPRVGIAAVVGSGQSDEEQSQRGVAHLTEHLWGRATPGGGAPVDVRLRDLGIEWSAWTTPDDTRFVVAGPARHLEALLTLEAARLRDPLEGVSAAALALERRVLQRELEQSGGRLAVAARLLAQVTPPDEPYRSWEDLPPEILESRTLEDARAWSAAHYRLDNTALRIVGAVQPDAVVRQLRAAFGAELGTEVPCPAPVDRLGSEAPELSPRPHPKRVSAVVPMPLAAVQWVVPGRLDDQLGAQVWAPLLSRYGSQALQVPVVCRVDDLERWGVLSCRWPSTEDDADAQVGSFLHVVDQILVELTRSLGFTAQRLAADAQAVVLGRAFEDAVGRQVVAAEVDGHLVVAAVAFARHGLPDPPGLEHSRYAGPSGREAVAAFGEAHLGSARAVSTLLVPAPGEAAVAAETLPSPRRPAADPVGPDLATWAHPPPLDRLQTRVLDNGLTVVTVEVPDDRPTQVSLMLEPGDGWRAELPENVARAAWLAVPAEVEPAGLHVRLAGMAPDAAIGQLERLLTGVALRSEAEVGQMLAPLVYASEHPAPGEVQASRFAHLHLWSMPALDTPEGLARVRAVSKDAAATWLQKLADPERARLVIAAPAGQLEGLVAIASARLGAWNPESTAVRAPVPATPPERAVAVFAGGPAAAASVTVSCVLGDDMHASHPAIWLVNRAVHDALRLQSGQAYTVGVQGGASIGGSSLSMQASVPPTLVGETVELFLQELRRVAAGEVEEAELAAALRAIGGRSALLWQSTEGLAGLALAEPGEQDLLGRLRAVTPQRLADTFAGCAGHEVITVLGDPALVTSELAGVGLEVAP